MNPEVRERSAELLLGSRYQMIRELGRGGFGHTYLAEDTHRFNELCVLKEFMPQVEGDAALQKAKQLFEREAGVLYQLKHPQIPQFRELLRVQTGGKGQLFLVQDYVEGPTYRELLYSRQCFSEAEAMFLLEQLLPVLDYIHSVGVIHRDIAPDNLILRNVDGRPVLIDFGGVKQLAATVGRQLCASNAESCAPESGSHLTRLGKVGYAPAEQIESGVANPSSDLYSLAVTVLTLLTGQEPQDLYDSDTRSWHWRQEVRLDSQLGAVLDRMLSFRVSDRYPSAQAVMQALQLPYPFSQTSLDSTSPSLKSFPSAAVTRNHALSSDYPSVVPEPQSGYSRDRTAESESPRQASGLWSALLGLVLVLGVVSVVWWVAAGNPSSNNEVTTDDLIDPPDSPSDSNAMLSAAELEQARKQKLDERRIEIGIDRDFLVRLTDQIFYEKYPTLKGAEPDRSP